MVDSLPIHDVVRLTGLSARALRFYEARGLIAPLRTGTGRRYYSAALLERLNQIVVLKRAGFSLSTIGALLAGRNLPLAQTLTTQLESIELQQSELAAAATLLRTALSRVESGEHLDSATLCSLIQHGEQIMTGKQAWDALSAPYMTDQAKADFAAAMPFPEEFDQVAYSAKWVDLGARIKAALPLDPTSDAAADFAAEWNELLAPFTAIATPAMAESVKAMYDDMPNWGDDAPSPGFDHEVWQFILAVAAARKPS